MRGRLFAVLGVVAAAACGGRQPAPRPAEPTPNAPRAAPEQPSLSSAEVAAILREIHALPEAEQAPHWQKWAHSSRSEPLRREALAQLVAIDPARAVDSAIADLDSELPERRTVAALALVEIGRPAAERAIPSLARASDEPAFVVARVALGDRAATKSALALLRRPTAPSLDLHTLAGSLSDAEALELSRDANVALRALAARALAQPATDVDALLRLANDPESSVSAHALVGIVRSRNERALEAMRALLARIAKESLAAATEVLAAELGGVGHVALAEALAGADRERSWFATAQAFRSIRALADPRAADALARYADSKPHVHFQTQAALALGELGDLRALPGLAKRLGLDPLKTYKDDLLESPLRRDDNERVQAARVAADLAKLHPAERARALAVLEKPLLDWITRAVSPHANGMRALSTLGSPRVLPHLSRWADPKAPLPKAGSQPPFPEEFVIAQSALRYLGRTRETRSWATLEKQLQRRPGELDVSQEALMEGGVAILGMTLRGLGVGASQGFAEWGDPKAAPLLVRFASDEKQHEQARFEACRSLGVIADSDALRAAMARFGTDRAAKRAIATHCALETLVRAREPIDGGPLIAALADPALEDPDLRAAIARALARTRHDVGALEKLATADPRGVAPALALMLAGHADAAVRAALRLEACAGCIELLAEAWFRSLGEPNETDFAAGRIGRWVALANRLARVRIGGAGHAWAKQKLVAAFGSWVYDSGPGTLTRNVLRVELQRAARGERAGHDPLASVDVLAALGERGALLALAERPDEIGARARRALKAPAAAAPPP